MATTPKDKKKSTATAAPAKSAAKKPAEAATKKSTKPSSSLDARTLGSALRQHGKVRQIDLGYFDLKQDGAIVGQLIVSQWVNGVIIPGTTMEYYYLFVASQPPYAVFQWPSETNSPESIEYVWQAGSPGPDFDPVAYQHKLPVANQLIACTCVDYGVVQP